jgi:polyisoprenoid-binding protein YceI
MIRRIIAVSTVVLASLPALTWAADFPLTDKNTTITFVGTKPGGKHDGGFKGITGSASAQNNDPTTLKFSVDIDVNSIYTDEPKLTAHLKSPDFFDVKANPKSKFVSTKVEKDGAQFKVTGDLTMAGKTKSITFPATVTLNGDGLAMSSSFAIDRTQWGMNYMPGKIDNPVKLKIDLKTK